MDQNTIALMSQFWYKAFVKKLIMHPKAREAIRSFPREVKDKLGQALLEVQQGAKLTMPKSRPMPTVAVGS